MRFELWTRGHAYEVHALRMFGESLVAVPFWKPPSCDTCSIRLSLAEIDSVRVEKDAPGKTIVLTTVLLAVTLYCVALITALSALGGT